MKMRRGRPKRSADSRKTQTRNAQERFRRRMARRGLLPMQAYVHREVIKVVDADADKKRETRGERVERALRKVYRLKAGGVK